MTLNVRSRLHPHLVLRYLEKVRTEGWQRQHVTFVVLNAKTVDDVKFFASLGISLNDINSFLLQVVTIIFSILLTI